MDELLKKYAHLLVNYCVSIKDGDRLFVHTTILAEPLAREVYRAAVAAGAALVEFNMDFRDKQRIFLEEANPGQLTQVSPFYRQALENFDAYLHIRAPFTLREEQDLYPEKYTIWRQAHRDLWKTYSRRTASGDLRRNLCEYPTEAAAREAGMSLDEFQRFVFEACKLYDEDPVASWRELSRRQQTIVDRLNQCSQIHYLGEGIDLRFSTKGRVWINSDGKTNMPSGELYTSPVEDSVNGVIYFAFPAIYQGQEVEGVTLWVKDGWVERWEARRGKAFLDRILRLEGSRRFGEAAIGANYDIRRFTKNILFDEKIGGTVHMALGQAYLQTGGLNESDIHWDMIADMRENSEIYADGEKIFENGRFLGLAADETPQRINFSHKAT
jgi:aminopeptidase